MVFSRVAEFNRYLTLMSCFEDVDSILGLFYWALLLFSGVYVKTRAAESVGIFSRRTPPRETILENC